jgi:hypothetical protein
VIYRVWAGRRSAVCRLYEMVSLGDVPLLVPHVSGFQRPLGRSIESRSPVCSGWLSSLMSSMRSVVRSTEPCNGCMNDVCSIASVLCNLHRTWENHDPFEMPSEVRHYVCSSRGRQERSFGTRRDASQTAHRPQSSVLGGVLCRRPKGFELMETWWNALQSTRAWMALVKYLVLASPEGM